MLHKSLLHPSLNSVLFRNFLPQRGLTTTQITLLNQKWRRERGLPLNPNACGVLTDAPDYTFLNGAPTPYGSRQRNRILKQQQIAEQIIKLTSEIDFAVDRYNKLQEEAENKKQALLDSKLKPKGIELLKKKK